MNLPDKTRLLQQIAAISAMERGTLSEYTFKERSAASGPYHKLQHWRSVQTIGHVRVRIWRRKYPRPALHSQQPSPGGLWEIQAQ